VPSDGVPGAVVLLRRGGGETGSAEDHDECFARVVGDPQALCFDQHPCRDHGATGERRGHELVHQCADRQHVRVVDLRAVQIVVLVLAGRPPDERGHAVADHVADHVRLG
jgi:hypothetical protein